MKILKIGKIFDFIFGATFLFLTAFVWIRYFLHNFWLTIVLSAIITFSIMAIYHYVQNRHNKAQVLTEKEKENANAISNEFLFLSKQDIVKKFNSKLSKKYQTNIKCDYIIINDNILRPVFSSATITDKEIIESYTKTLKISASKLIIVCKNATEDAKKIATLMTGKKVLIIEENEAYEDIYKPLNFDVPKQLIKHNKKTANDYLSFALCRARTKNYLLVAIFLLISSFVLRYNIYYIIFATITTLLALYSHFNKRFNKQKTKVLN